MSRRQAKRPRFVEPASEESLQRQFRERGWTDQLPIVLPTAQRGAAADVTRQPRRGRAATRYPGIR